jgi:hypothetical protein|tara:strand:- start:449 stop:820 length:372 start_codon:yes stop_codon:yes gene_type:complete
VTEGVCIMAEMREDRGELDLTLQVEKLKKRAEEAEGELTIIKGIGNNSPEMKALQKSVKEKDELIQELRMRIRDMLLISEQHRDILGAEITHRKRLEKEVRDLKVQMSEYLSVRVKGSRDNAC